MNKFKPKILASLVLSATLLFSSASTALAHVEDEGVEAIAITVIVPPHVERPAPTTPQPSRRVFPINVAEGYNYEGVRELVRIYELLPGESPEWINTDSFSRNGYYYQIAEITRRVDVAHTVREHTEVVEIPSATNNLAAVIAGLDLTMDFVDEDGYVGILHLDIRSIEMTQDGTRSTSRTVSQTREFPHLSSPDMALIPLTINVSGRTYNLADVDWRTNTSNPIDFNSVAQTFTAFATYTRTATSTVSTGYTTIAEYNGILTRVASGDVRFVATFIGTPIVSPVVNRPSKPSVELETMPIIEVSNDDEQVYEEIETPVGEISENDYAYDTKQQSEDYDTPINKPLLFGLIAIIVGLVTFLVCIALKFWGIFRNMANQQNQDKAKALSSRMSAIIEQDREELESFEGFGDDYEFEDFGDFDVSSIEIDDFQESSEEGEKDD